ncbi:MAG: hypothetical protein DYH13_04575 [Alphaproteobacteria bacterium PRO2]|nr:hypothetical protein [Alphaproteobacteria bacterium PRO2]
MTERGNVMFYILIAVALLAALIFAVAQSGRGNIQQVSEEKARLYATEIIQSTGTMANGVAQLRLRGVRDTEISFDNPSVPYPNANCADDTCKLFHPAGAGLTYAAPDMQWLDESAASATGFGVVGGMIGQWYFPYNTCVWQVGAGGDNCHADNSDNTELMVWLPWVKREVCLQINQLLGIPNPGGEPPSIGGTMINNTAPKFAGTYPTGAHVHVQMPTITAACVYHGSAPASPGLGYFYYKVLIVR